MKLNPKPATRMGQTARMVVFGLSGSGKTLFALDAAKVFANGDMSRVLVIDTENESAGLYSDEYPFQIQPWAGNHDPEDLADLINQADKSPDFDVIVVDGASPFWDGQGGVLDIVEKHSNGKNGFAGWGKATPKHNELMAQIMSTSKHLIVTTRAKNAQPDEKNMALNELGVKPVQRDTFFYEFNTAIYIDPAHRPIVVKSRCFDLQDKPYKADGGTQDLAETISQWLQGNSKYVNADQSGEIISKFDSIDNKEARNQAKKQFASNYGNPKKIDAEQFTEALQAANELFEEYSASDPFETPEEAQDD